MFITIVALCVCAAPPAAAEQVPDSFGNLRRCRPRAVLLGLEPGTADRAFPYPETVGLDAGISRCGARVVTRNPRLGLVRVEVTSGEDLPAACARLKAASGALYAEPDWIGQGGFIPDDTYFGEQWHLPRIEAPAAWDLTRGSEQVIVAVLDTGIDPFHPEFEGRVLPGYDFVNDHPDPIADHPHGIHTSGLLGANADNGFGVAGVDHRCRILPVKVLDSNNEGFLSDLVDGLDYAVNEAVSSKARMVVNMSLIRYPPDSPTLDKALSRARENGVVLVACAGNGGLGDADVSGPGSYPQCISVGASNFDDMRASFSATGNALDVLAPGSSVVTAAQERIDSYDLFSGCSAATPIVAGIASLLLSVDPTLRPEDVQELLQRGAQDQIGGPEDTPGWDPEYGWGRVNARRSLELIRERFLRGDVNADGTLDISDSIFELMSFFIDARSIPCPKAADANDDGLLDVSDPILILDFLFQGGILSPPYPACGLDPTPDSLECLGGCVH